MIDKLKTYKPSAELVLGSIGGLVAIILALLFANFYINRARGANPPLSISFSPNSGNLAASQPQEISMFLQTSGASDYIEGFDIVLNATGQTQFTNLVCPQPNKCYELIGVSNPADFTEIVVDVQPQRLRVSYVTLENDPARLPNNILIKFNITGIAAGAGGITVDTAASSVVGRNSVGTAYDITNPDTASYNFTTGTPSLWLVPSAQTVDTNQTFDVQIKFNTGTANVAAVDAVLNYNPAYLSVTNVVNATTFPTYVGIDGSSNYVDSVNGKIKIGGQIDTTANPPQTVNGSDLLFSTITFQALQPIASTDVLFEFLQNDSTESNIVEYSTSNDVLASVGNGAYTINAIVPTATPIPPTSTPVPTGVPTPTNTPTPTITPIPPTATPIPPTATPVPPTATPLPPTATPIPTIAPSTVAVNLSLDLEGRTAVNKNNRDVRLTVEETGYTTTGTTDNAGDALNISLGQLTPGTYTLRVKPSGYLSKNSILNITTSGSYIVDFGTSQFLAGDISIVEDDVINSLDYARLLINYFKEGLTIDLFDFNGDAVINGIDFSYMLRNWTRS